LKPICVSQFRWSSFLIFVSSNNYIHWIIITLEFEIIKSFLVLENTKKNPHMIDAQVLKHIVKYKLPSSIQGSLRWHKFQLQDLLTMVEKLECCISF
jgi:hypothetical protein